MSTLNCPSCGGAIEGVTPLIRSIDCSYCGSWLRLSNQLWKAESGQKTPLNAPGFLRVGMTGTNADGIHYMVRGRLRFQYEQGTWDEWWLESSEGESFWVEEDDGVYYRHFLGEDLTLSNGINASVGQMLSLPDGKTLFITEKLQADIVGREGLLPIDLSINAAVTYLDGVADGEEYSLEIEGNQASISQSTIFDLRTIRWETA